MDKKIIVDTLRLAYQYLGKAVADGELANCAKPVESAFKQVGLVLSELECEEDEMEAVRKQERDRILRIYNETIAIIPDAGLVAILQTLKE